MSLLTKSWTRTCEDRGGCQGRGGGGGGCRFTGGLSSVAYTGQVTYVPTYMRLVPVMSQRAGGRKSRALKGCWVSTLESDCLLARHWSR